jgi:hypothetical protein
MCYLHLTYINTYKPHDLSKLSAHCDQFIKNVSLLKQLNVNYIEDTLVLTFNLFLQRLPKSFINVVVHHIKNAKLNLNQAVLYVKNFVIKIIQ